MPQNTQSSASTSDLEQYRWVSFAQTAGATFAPLSASFTPNTVEVFSVQARDGMASTITTRYRFAVTSGILPAWVKPSVSVAVTASVIVDGTTHVLSRSLQVEAIDTVAGKYFDVIAPYNGSLQAQHVSITALEAGPSVALNLMSQKAMLRVISGAVLLAPCIDFAGDAPHSETLTAADGLYELTAPVRGKHDLGEWYIKQDGAGEISVRFL